MADPKMPSVGDEVVVWFGEIPDKLTGVVIAVISPGEAYNVEITSIGTLPDYYSHIVGDVFAMWRLRRLADARYDTYFWSPVGEEVKDGREDAA